MPRRKQFTVDAESVQGNAGATVTFKCITVGEAHTYRTEDTITDRVFLAQHILAWSGLVDDEGAGLPAPSQDAIDMLYRKEHSVLVRLLWKDGPDEDSAKN